MNPKYRIFVLPTIISVVLLGGVLGYLGLAAFVTALILVALEVTLSFDNAVVNAKVLKNMSPVWQRRFLTWGILIAVVGTRIILPILIVAVSVGMSPWAVSQLAAFHPEEYGHLLEGAHYAIAAFGGMFLLMVALKYFLDVNKDVHWIRAVERHVSKWGHIEAVEIASALILLVAISMLVPHEAVIILTAGIIGLVTFVLVEGIGNSFTVEAGAAGGLSLFLYLEVLDTSFSLDGVIGAFAITSVLPVIIIGLGIGAYFVRTLTIYLVRQKTLESLVYVEHGAHWAILGLALSMLATLIIPIPELVIGFIGIAFIGASVYSSFWERRASLAKTTSN
ncbi:MAG: uncharacterized protein QOE22_126 [Candidatus Parcubacteria bacterium]|jgi:hypothetical protein|nr:uncharacterized protein [Candidatus Parcubacteria bacterium]